MTARLNTVNAGIRSGSTIARHALFYYLFNTDVHMCAFAYAQSRMCACAPMGFRRVAPNARCMADADAGVATKGTASIQRQKHVVSECVCVCVYACACACVRACVPLAILANAIVMSDIPVCAAFAYRNAHVHLLKQFPFQRSSCVYASTDVHRLAPSAQVLAK